MNQGRTSTKANTRQESSDHAPSVDELRTAYERHDGNVTATASEFEHSTTSIRNLLVAAGIHEKPEPPLAHRLENADPDDVGSGEAAL